MSPEPEGLPARILELGEELRREGVAVGTSEMLDAFGVLREISWTSQEDFREALAATLAKSQEDRRVFELVFDRFFFRAVEIRSLTALKSRSSSKMPVTSLIRSMNTNERILRNVSCSACSTDRKNTDADVTLVETSHST